MAKVYISAPITGYDLKERKEYFASKAEWLRDLEFEPVNPMADIDIGNPPPREDCMKRDIKMLLDCTAMILFGDWQNSEGCNLEMLVAKQCGIWVFTDERTQQGLRVINRPTNQTEQNYEEVFRHYD